MSIHLRMLSLVMATEELAMNAYNPQESYEVQNTMNQKWTRNALILLSYKFLNISEDKS